MSDTTQHTPADVRERVARECVEEAERLRYWYGEWYARAQRLLREAAALLRAPRGEGEAEPVAWGVECRRRGVGDRWYHLSTYTNELDACERARNVERAMRVLECRVIPLYASPAAALRSEAQGDAEALAAEILAELRRAREMFPDNNVMTLALVEEVGELAKATFEESRDRVRKEAIQVAVLAMRVVLDGDRTLDAWRESKGLDPLTAARRGEGGE